MMMYWMATWMGFGDDHIPRLIIPTRSLHFLIPPEDRILVVGIRWLNPILRDKWCCDLTVTSLGMMVRSSVTIPKWPWVVEIVFIPIKILIWWLNPIHSHTTVSIHFLVLGCYCQSSWTGDSNQKKGIPTDVFGEYQQHFFEAMMIVPAVLDKATWVFSGVSTVSPPAFAAGTVVEPATFTSIFSEKNPTQFGKEAQRLDDECWFHSISGAFFEWKQPQEAKRKAALAAIDGLVRDFQGLSSPRSSNGSSPDSERSSDWEVLEDYEICEAQGGDGMKQMSWEAFFCETLETWRHGGMMGWNDISWEACFFVVKVNGDLEILETLGLCFLFQTYYWGMMIPPSGTDGWSWKDQEICLVGIMHCDSSPFGDRFFSRARTEHDFFFWTFGSSRVGQSPKSFCKWQQSPWYSHGIPIHCSPPFSDNPWCHSPRQRGLSSRGAGAGTRPCHQLPVLSPQGAAFRTPGTAYGKGAHDAAWKQGAGRTLTLEIPSGKLT